METENNGEEPFRIRSYGKSELASLYMPDIEPGSAVCALNRWIKRVPGLVEALAGTGLGTRDKRYTPEQVRLIVSKIGEP